MDDESSDTAEDISEDDKESLIEHADDKIDALINLLVKKGIITEQEFDASYEDLFEDEDE